MSQHGTILLVEADPDRRAELETLLHRAGYHVVATGDGLRAVELACEHLPAAALVDLLLPGQSGLQVTLALKAQFGDLVRVAVMSVNASPALQDYAAALGAERFLPKPFPLAAALDTVADLCPPLDAPAVRRPRARIGA
jgi:CheY-like chemotaxis protein